MVTPERRHLRNIVVDSEQKATELAEQAKSSAGFAQLAAENSMDESIADKGGDLGTLTRTHHPRTPRQHRRRGEQQAPVDS